MNRSEQRPNKTHPLILGAAASVMLVSLVGVGTIAGVIPTADELRTVAGTEKSGRAPSGGSRELHIVPSAACASCGIVEAQRTVEIKGDAATASNVDADQPLAKRFAYRVTVRMEDGSYRTVSQASAPAFAIGDRVRIVDGALVAVRAKTEN